MRIRIDHSSRYSYEAPQTGIIQILRLTPSSTDGQRVLSWRIDIDADGRLIPFEDAHGNRAHVFYCAGAVDRLTVRVHGEVVLEDRAGVVGWTYDRLPAEVYLRTTPLTEPDHPITRLAVSARDKAGGEGELAILHRLMQLVHERMAFDTRVTEPMTTASEAFALGRGVCQDIAQIFVSAVRTLEIAARYVHGHYAPPDHPDQEAAHAWAEALVPGLGWVGFDPTHGLSPGPHHVRVAAGLDALDVAPIRGSRRGPGPESLEVIVHGRSLSPLPVQPRPPAAFLGIEQTQIVGVAEPGQPPSSQSQGAAPRP